MPYSIWRLAVSSSYPPSLASRSNTRVPPDSLSRLRANLAVSPPLATRLPLFLPLFFWYLSLLPSLICHLAAWDFSFPLLCFAVCHLFTPHLPSAASSHSSTLIPLPLSLVQIFYFSFHNFPCSLYPSPCSSLPT